MADYKRELEELVSVVSAEGASDLHLSVGHHPTIRISSDLVPLVKYEKLGPEDTMGFAIEFLSDENQKRFLARKEIDFSYSPGATMRFRGNAFFQRGVVSIAMRVIPQSVPTLQQLNLPEVLLGFAQKKQGFFLVVGPTGHGKSTTLASIINHINQDRAEHIITIEDPIEYLIPGACQIQVKITQAGVVTAGGDLCVLHQCGGAGGLRRGRDIEFAVQCAG